MPDRVRPRCDQAGTAADRLAPVPPEIPAVPVPGMGYRTTSTASGCGSPVSAESAVATSCTVAFT